MSLRATCLETVATAFSDRFHTRRWYHGKGGVCRASLQQCYALTAAQPHVCLPLLRFLDSYSVCPARTRPIFVIFLSCARNSYAASDYSQTSGGRSGRSSQRSVAAGTYQCAIVGARLIWHVPNGLTLHRPPLDWIMSRHTAEPPARCLASTTLFITALTSTDNGCRKLNILLH